MKIAINALTLRKGGTLVVLNKLLTGFVEIAPDNEYHVLANLATPAALEGNPQVKYHHFDWTNASYARVAFWYVAVLPLWLRRHKIDVLFSQICYLPPFAGRRTVLLLQDAKFFYDSKELRRRLTLSERFNLWLKKRWSYHSVGMADRILVQSDTMARSVIAKVPSVRDRVSTVHHGPGILNGQSKPIYRAGPSDSFEIAYVAIYRGYKNFEVLLRALRLLDDEGIPARLHLTLDVIDNPGARAVIAYARKIGVEHAVVNHGELEPERVSEVYQAARVFVFPSICESFGFPQVEAMAFGLPILAADTPINREICNQAAIYFDPEDEHLLAAQLRRLYKNPTELNALSERSARRGRDFGWTGAAAETLKWLKP
jgi:glycosyltransferase involved in cell wall biosynthesis